MRHIQALLRHIEQYSDILTTLAHLEFNASLKACLTCKMIKHIQNFQAFSRIFRIFKDIDAYSATLTGEQLGGGGRLPSIFWKSKKLTWFRPFLGYIFHSRFLGEKTQKCGTFPCGAYFFLFFFDKIFIEVL